MSKFSEQNLDIADVVAYRADVEAWLRLFYAHSEKNPRFLGYKPDAVMKELDERLAELDLTSVFVLLSAIEAAFRIDYQQRCFTGSRHKDNLSLAFRRLRKRKKARINLDTEILTAWKIETTVDSHLIGSLRGAFKLRHWIAHGRLGDPRVGKQYDFFSIQALAAQVFATFQLLKPSN